MFRLAMVNPETAADEQQNERAKQETTLALQARFAQQTFEGAIGHDLLPRHLLLAVWTIMRRTPCQTNALDLRTAARTRFSLAAIDAKLSLIAAWRTVAADVIANTRTAPVDGPRQHRRNGTPQPIRGGSVER